MTPLGAFCRLMIAADAIAAIMNAAHALNGVPGYDSGNVWGSLGAGVAAFALGVWADGSRRAGR